MDVEKPTDEEINKVVVDIFNTESTKNFIQGFKTSLQDSNDMGSAMEAVFSFATSPTTINDFKSVVQQNDFKSLAQQNDKALTRSEHVKIFTEQSKGVELPNHPRKMSRDEVLFLTKMVTEELQELLVTVTYENEDVKELLVDIVTKSTSPTYNNKGKNDLELMAEQVDAFVDIDYYNCNAAAKVGFNVDDVFNLVHQANMNKKFEDGTFHKNSEGKVIKPPSWTEPDVKEVISKWINQGTWTNK